MEGPQGPAPAGGPGDRNSRQDLRLGCCRTSTEARVPREGRAGGEGTASKPGPRPAPSRSAVRAPPALRAPLPAAHPARYRRSAPPAPGPSRWGEGPSGGGPRGLSRLLVCIGVRLLYFCFFLPPSRLSCAASHPCSSSAPFLHVRPPAQPTDERSWVYSPLHYSAHAHPASDGESDTVSAPAARHAWGRGLGPPALPHLPWDRRGHGGLGGRGGGGAGPRPGGPAGGGAARPYRAHTRPLAFRSNVYAVTDPEPSARRRRPGRVPEALPARRSWLHRRPPPIPSTTYACETVNLPECPIMYLFWVLTLCTKTAAQVCFFRKRFKKKKKKDVSE